ncbi:MAG: ArsR/SmtB family transcription factor [Thermoplasmata archaeon]
MPSRDICGSEYIDEKKVKDVDARMLDQETFHRLSEMFKALGDGTRIRILYALSKDELCPCELAVLLGSSMSAISHQLRLLRALDFVRSRREGKNVRYSLYDEHVGQLLRTTVDHLKE